MILAFAGCEEVFLDDDLANTPRGNFESMWQTVRDKYSFFEFKNIDWNQVYTKYSARIHSDMSDQELFTVLDSMLFTLKDGHVNLVSPFDLSRNWQWFLNAPPNFNFDIVERNYLGNDHRIAGGLRYTLLSDSIGYLYYGSFSSGFSSANLREMFAYLKDVKGIIVDVRDNGGGSLDAAFALAQRFINAEKRVLISQEKTGPGSDDFGNTVNYTLAPPEAPHFEGPVMLLTNRKCFSATNTFVAILRNFSNVTQIGDRTGGGGGLPIDSELPNGWRYRFSATASFLPNGFNIEQGIAPEIRMDMDTTALLQGKDNIIEEAIRQLQ